MSESNLGLTESVAIALGGMIGGGIYAVLGVVAGITRGATWAAFVLAGAVTAAFSAVGSLGAITSFASLAFIVVFGAMSYLAFRQREDAVSTALPALGTVGATAFFPLMLWNLYNREPNTFYTVLVVAAVVVTVELVYFEREFLSEAVERIEPDDGRFPGST